MKFKSNNSTALGTIYACPMILICVYHCHDQMDILTCTCIEDMLIILEIVNLYIEFYLQHNIILES